MHHSGEMFVYMFFSGLLMMEISMLYSTNIHWKRGWELGPPIPLLVLEIQAGSPPVLKWI